MAANGLDVLEDADMSECDGEKVVTMMDVLQEQQEIEEDAKAVLGASDDKNCTYSKGYIKRQAVYACLTCCSDAKVDPSKRAGVCLACSLNCHENHDLVELYTKRNFRCDCGNPKFNSHPCHYSSDKNVLNDGNVYNQNFSGLYCTCHRPYPDPEATVEECMIQCIICEDWLHASHLEATVPASDQYSEMICKQCMDKNKFLHDYSNFAVNTEDLHVDIIKVNGNSLDTMDNCKKPDNVIESSEELDECEIKNVTTEDVSGECHGEVNKEIGDDKNNATSTSSHDHKIEESSLDSSEDNATEMKTDSSVLPDTTVDNLAESMTSNEDNISTNAPESIDDESITEKIEPTHQDLEKPNSDQDQIKTSETVSDDKIVTEENTTSDKEKEQNEDAIGECGEIKVDDTMKPTENIECRVPDVTERIENTNDAIDSCESKIASAEHDHTETNLPDLIESNKLDAGNSTKISLSRVDPLNGQEAVEGIESKSEEGQCEDSISEPSNSIKNSTVPENTNSEVPEIKTTNVDITDLHKDKNTTNIDMNKSETCESNVTETSYSSYKRKLSAEDCSVNDTNKKIKCNENNCCRSQSIKKLFRGATFWQSSFRQKLCTCSECMTMYKDLSVLYLLDPEDTVSAYEALGKQISDGTTDSQYEKGLEALSSLDRIQQINALTEYNNMRDKLLDFLKSFKDKKEVVKEEDIKAFFAGMKPKREPDGVYFCR